MSIGIFKKNRSKVQDTFFSKEYFNSLTEDELEIEEKGFSAKLKKVVIENIPIDKKSFNERMFVLDFELKGVPTLSKYEDTKNIEKALLIIGATWIHIFLFEMKSDIGYAGDKGIRSIVENKFADSLSRFFMHLPVFIFDSVGFRDMEFEFYGILFYQTHNALQTEIRENEAIKDDDLVKIFQKKHKSNIVNINDIYGNNPPVNIKFIQNTTKTDTLKVDFEDLLPDDADKRSRLLNDIEIKTEKGLPRIYP